MLLLLPKFNFCAAGRFLPPVRFAGVSFDVAFPANEKLALRAVFRRLVALNGIFPGRIEALHAEYFAASWSLHEGFPAIHIIKTSGPWVQEIPVTIHLTQMRQ